VGSSPRGEASESELVGADLALYAAQHSQNVSDLHLWSHWCRQIFATRVWPIALSTDRAGSAFHARMAAAASTARAPPGGPPPCPARHRADPPYSRRGREHSERPNRTVQGRLVSEPAQAGGAAVTHLSPGAVHPRLQRVAHAPAAPAPPSTASSSTCCLCHEAVRTTTPGQRGDPRARCLQIDRHAARPAYLCRPRLGAFRGAAARRRPRAFARNR
jgi:hypothetical protein